MPPDAPPEILIVESSSTQALRRQHVLRQHGMASAIARTGGDALRMLAERPFALILLDYQLPDIDGCAVCRQAKANHAGLRAILLLSLAETLALAQALMCGADDIVAKPYADDALVRAVRNILASDAGGASTSAERILQSVAAIAVEREAQLREAREAIARLTQELEGLRQAAGPQAPPAKTPAQADKPAGLRILLAEDSDVNQKLVQRLLTTHGHQVVVVGDGRRALDALASERFDLVLMDIEMPVLDGFGATALIRGAEERTGEHIPIVAMTAHDDPGDLERCLGAGMDGYIAKPLRMDALLPYLPAPKPAETPVFDRASALGAVEGDEALLDEIIGLFRQEAPSLMERIRGAMQRGSGADLERAAHSLKGSAASLGAARVVALAQRLEKQGTADDLAAAAQTAAEMEQALAEFLRAIK